MSQLITEAFVQQYNANIMMLSQQRGSKLEGTVKQTTQKGTTQYFDQIGTVAAVKKTGRHSSTPQLDTPHSRRSVTLTDYEWADMIDDQDKIRMLIDPTSDYSMAAAWAFGRAKDTEIIQAALGTAMTGQKGNVAVALPNTQKYAANNGTNLTDLNVRTLRAVKRKFDAAEVMAPRYMAITAAQLESLLAQTEVTNADYNSVRALVNGEVNSFVGFNFTQLELLPLTTATSANQTTGGDVNGSVAGSIVALTGTNRACIAYTQEGILLSKGEDFVTKISERDDKSYSTQVYARMSIGATRMEEVQVVEVICKEA